MAYLPVPWLIADVHPLATVNALLNGLATVLLIWALRPNIKKLFAGQERVVKFSLHGWLRARKEAASQK